MKTGGKLALATLALALLVGPVTLHALGSVSLTFTASPTTIAPGGTATLSWTATNADDCTGSGTGGSTATSGSRQVSPAVTTTYSVTCYNNEPPVTQRTVTATVTVSSGGATASISASPTSITSGGSATLTWSSTNASSCTGTNFNTGGTVSGSVSVSPTVNTTYTVTCGSATSNTTVTVSAASPNLIAGLITPTSATANSATALSSTIQNTGTGSTGAGFTNLFQRATSAAGASTIDIGTHSATTLAASGNTVATLSYTFPSAATWYVRACADKNSAASAGTITESNEADNCSAWRAVTVSAPAATASISASQTSIPVGYSTTLTWSSTNATSCTGQNFNTGFATAASVTVAPTTMTQYIVTCGSASASVVVNVYSGSPNQGIYSPSQIASQHGGNVCGLDTAGGSGSIVQGGYFGGGSVSSYDPSVFPVGFFDTPTRYCFQETETWINQCQGCGADTVNQYEWRRYNATYVSNPSAASMYPTGNPGQNNYKENYSFYISAPAPTASISASPSTVVIGSSSTLTWSSTNATSCTGTNFSTGNATSGSVAVSPASNTTYSVSCTGAGGTANNSATVTVTAGTIDFTSGVPSLNTGSLVSGLAATFKGNVTNGGTGNTSATFSNRFQIDLGNNGSWDTDLDAASSITGLNSGQTKQAVSPSWTVVSGTHAIRLCADSPTSVVAESNESNNCGTSWVFTVSAAPNAPTISGPTTGYTNTSYQFSFTATDPAGNTLRYGVDWDNNGIVDEYLPASGYVASGISHYQNRTWTTTGTKTFKALTQNSLGASSGWTSHAITISTAPPPPPTALLTVSPGTISAGQSSTITWSSSNATSCTGTGFSTGGATSGSLSSGALYTSTSFSVTCSGATPPPDSDTATVTVESAPDLISGIPGLNSGTPHEGQVLTFWASIENQGIADTNATFSNRFQVDINANGSWDSTLDAPNSITGLVVGQSKQVTSPGWTAVLGTHRVRVCADSPVSVVGESDESNNCSTSYLTFVVTQPECADGIDNNGNGLVDTADNACTNSTDPTEEVLPSGLLTLVAFPADADIASGFVRKSTPALLAWTVTDVAEGSCTLSGENGDSWVLSGTSGSQLTSPIESHTTYTLRCLDLNAAPVQLQTEVRTAPVYEEV